MFARMSSFLVVLALTVPTLAQFGQPINSQDANVISQLINFNQSISWQGLPDNQTLPLLCDIPQLNCTTNGRIWALYLGAQRFHGIPIPASIGNLAELEFLDLGGNSFTGPFPTSFCQLQKLTALYLGGNYLTGPLPDCLCTMTSLQSLGLEYNQFTGNLPACIGNLTNLEYLNVDNNNLTGSLPTSLEQLQNLRAVWLSRNQFTGNVNLFLNSSYAFPNLTSLSLRLNKFTGPLPEVVYENRTLAALEQLNLEANQFTGTVPSTLETLLSIRYLSLSFNLFDALPDWNPESGRFANLSTAIFVQYNRLTTVPSVLGSERGKFLVDVSCNNLTITDLPEWCALTSCCETCCWWSPRPVKSPTPQPLTTGPLGAVLFTSSSSTTAFSSGPLLTSSSSSLESSPSKGLPPWAIAAFTVLLVILVSAATLVILLVRGVGPFKSAVERASDV